MMAHFVVPILLWKYASEAFKRLKELRVVRWRENGALAQLLLLLLVSFRTAFIYYFLKFFTNRTYAKN